MHAKKDGRRMIEISPRGKFLTYYVSIIIISTYISHFRIMSIMKNTLMHNDKLFCDELMILQMKHHYIKHITKIT